MKVQINRIGLGAVTSFWSFKPASVEAEVRMRRMFKATWTDGVMHVDQRYAIETAQRLSRAGVKLTRQEDDVEIAVKNGDFVVKRSAA